jgi:hypothetical protein
VNSNLATSAATTAFIITIAIVFPMQACGPVINERKEVVELKSGGRLSQRLGLNLFKIKFEGDQQAKDREKNPLFSVVTPYF